MNPIRIYSNLSTALAEIRGGYRRYNVTRSINRETSVLKRWIVLSPGRMNALVDYLWGKWLWDELSAFELEVFLTIPNVLNETTINLSLKAKIFGISKKIIRERLRHLNYLIGTKFITREQYLSIKANCTFFFIEEERPLARTRKYSGYARHHNDQGSLPKIKPDMVSDLVEFHFNEDQSSMIFEFLTVGEIISPNGQIYFLPEDGTKKYRNGKEVTKLKPKRT